VAKRRYIDLAGPGHPIRPHPNVRDDGDNWLRGVLGRPDFTPGMKISATCLVRVHFNWTSGQCNPGLETIRVGTGQDSTRSVEKQLKRLREAGVIAWRKSFQTSNRYWLLLKPNAGSLLDAGKYELPAGIGDVQYRTSEQPIPNPGRVQSRTVGRTNPCLTPVMNPSSANTGREFGIDVPPELAAKVDLLICRLGEHGSKVWLGGAEFVSGDIIQCRAASPAKVNYIRDKLAAHFDFVFDRNWTVMERARAA
jgi:hypothetical protein